MAESITPPPLDAYVTAKPDEPTWSVQGGDPLGGPLLRIWAAFARIQAGVIKPGVVDGIFAELLNAANKNPPENDRERTGLLIRATQTEEVSWTMDEYRAGRTGADIDPNVPLENSLDEKARLDLHDRRVHAAQTVNNMVAELNDISQAMTQFDFGDPLDHILLRETVENLKTLSGWLEPRRLFQRG